MTFAPRIGLCLVTAFVWLLTMTLPARAVTNTAEGGIGGIDNGTLVGGDGTGTAQFTLESVELALVKQARDLGGGVLPDGAEVYPDQEIYFVLFVDNPADFPAGDVEITDLLDETQFTYVAGSLEEAVVPSGSDDAAIWAGNWTPLTDDVGAPDDAASATDTGGDATADRITVGAASEQANRTVEVPGSSLRAFRFRVRVK